MVSQIQVNEYVLEQNGRQTYFILTRFLKNLCGRYRIWTCDFFLV